MKVFVDHPLYIGSEDIYGMNSAFSYVEGGGMADLDLRCSILCQAALAAPVLLWGPSALRARFSAKAEMSLPEEETPRGALPEVPFRPSLSAWNHTPQNGASRNGASRNGASRNGAMQEAPQEGPSEAWAAGPAEGGVDSLEVVEGGVAVSGEVVEGVGAAEREGLVPAAESLSVEDRVALIEQGLGEAGLAGPEGVGVSVVVTEMREPAPGEGSAGAPGEPGPAADRPGGAAAPVGDAPELGTTQGGAAVRGVAAAEEGAGEGRDDDDADAGPLDRLIFVGNDWPCAPLALRLQHLFRSPAPPTEASPTGAAASAAEGSESAQFAVTGAAPVQMPAAPLVESSGPAGERVAASGAQPPVEDGELPRALPDTAADTEAPAKAGGELPVLRGIRGWLDRSRGRAQDAEPQAPSENPQLPEPGLQPEAPESSEEEIVLEGASPLVEAGVEAVESSGVPEGGLPAGPDVSGGPFAEARAVLSAELESAMKGVLSNSVVAFCIHNLAYQGKFAKVRAETSGVGPVFCLG